MENVVTDSLKEILEGDYQFVLIMGDYYDCPSCAPGATLSAYTHYDEKTLVDEMLKYAGSCKMVSIYVLDIDFGDMEKYCNIETTTGHHNVVKMEFDLPNAGHVIIHQEKGKWVVAGPAHTVLYGKKI